MRTLPRAVGVLAATLVFLCASAAEPPVSVTDLTVVSWNICGEAGGLRGQVGYCPYRDEPAKKIDQVVQVVEERGADVVMLQEVCGGDEAGSHMDLLQQELGSDWTIRHAAGARPDGRTDCRGVLTGELGVLIAVKGTITSSIAEDTLPDSPDDARTSPVLCVTVAGWATTPCVAHLISDEDDRAAEQTVNVKEFLAEHAPGDLVLGGDLNRNKAAAALILLTSTYETCLDAYTYHGWNGTTQEHAWHKLDHFLVSRPSYGTRAVVCAVDTTRMDTTANETDSGDPNGYSDHAPIIGTFRDAPVAEESSSAPTTAHTVTVNRKATSGESVALNVTSDNPDASAMYLTGVEAGRGTLKTAHVGDADGSDANASAQGIYVTATDGATKGSLIALRNNTGLEDFVVKGSGRDGVGIARGATPQAQLHVAQAAQDTASAILAEGAGVGHGTMELPPNSSSPSCRRGSPPPKGRPAQSPPRRD